MSRILRYCLLPFAGVLLLAADASWKAKPVSQWNADDAKQVLTDSPWVKYVTPEWLRDLSASERREGGDMTAGIGKGVGLDGIIGIFNPEIEAAAIARAHAKPTPDAVAVRWESAFPVRMAEQKIGETDVPALASDDYAIAVYGITIPRHYNLAAELKGIASLRRYQKKDLKPSHVEIVNRDEDGKATVVYLFPRKVEITKKDGGIQFAAQIGRLFVAQYFYTSEMQFQGDLQVLMPSN